ncbi:DUF6531 domain-containing protein [Pseudomonas lijiangensis]|uniref:DUF6531 domain-containing protein n=1 Tax=Pseudomonas lijiangensis TaxID=2995658 RepID=UPI0031BA10BA
MKRFWIALFLICAVGCSGLKAEEFTYWDSGSNGSISVFSKPWQGCEYLVYEYAPGLANAYAPHFNRYNVSGAYECYLLTSGGWEHHWGTISKVTVSCLGGATLNYMTAKCGFNGQKGAEDDELSCKSPSMQVGNPINAATGNKFQYEEDFRVGVVGPIVVGRYYNSMDGLWRHSYSSSLNVGADFVVLVRSDGRESLFKLADGKYSSATDLGSLIATDTGWTFKSLDGSVMSFSESGQLTKVVSPQGLVHNVSRDKYNVTVTNEFGQSVKFADDILGQLKALESGDTKIQYAYQAQRLTGLSKNVSGLTSTRSYHYEDARNAGLLTGITDERGVRFATWSYDDRGRAISSQHSGGAGLTQIVYNEDGSSSVTNELGKTMVYRYKQIEGVKRIIAIEGEPTPNCPASNSTYTYNSQGQILTKTDAKGQITNYSYNARGLEVSRTEAAGTAVARTTSTEWHPDRSLPVKVIEPNRITEYSYDSQGRELTRQVTSR